MVSLPPRLASRFAGRMHEYTNISQAACTYAFPRAFLKSERCIINWRRRSFHALRKYRGRKNEVRFREVPFSINFSLFHDHPPLQVFHTEDLFIVRTRNDSSILIYRILYSILYLKVKNKSDVFTSSSWFIPRLFLYLLAILTNNNWFTIQLN